MTHYLLLLSIFLVGIVFYLAGRKVTLKLWKKMVVALAGSAFGLFGLFVMGYIENGRFGPISFFGAHFIGPLGILISCRTLKISKKECYKMLDISAPALCAALVVLKLNCYRVKCCGGIVLSTHNDVVCYFPSQIVESIFAFVLMTLFMFLLMKDKAQGSIYLLYMIVYGIGRFVLNIFRETTIWILDMPAGNFWSIISVIIGAGYLYIRYLLTNAQEEKKRTRANRTGHKVRR